MQATGISRHQVSFAFRLLVVVAPREVCCSNSASREREREGGIMVVVGKHFTFLLIVVYWEIPT